MTTTNRKKSVEIVKKANSKKTKIKKYVKTTENFVM